MDWFSKKPISSSFLWAILLIFIVKSSNNNNFNIWMFGFDNLSGLDSIHLRHIDIHENKWIFKYFGGTIHYFIYLFNCHFTIKGAVNRKVLDLFKKHFHRVDVIDHIINNKNSGFLLEILLYDVNFEVVVICFFWFLFFFLFF